MEQSLSDLLSDVFSETSVPSFPDQDMDFENLTFDEKVEAEKTHNSHENPSTKEDRALHQEATGEAAALSGTETKEIYMAESADIEQTDDNGDDEDVQDVRASVMNVDRAPEDNYTSSDGDFEEEGSVSGEDKEDEEEDVGTGVDGDLLMSVCCSEEFCYGNKEGRIFAEGQPLSLQDAENPQVRNEDQGESESNEELSYFGRIPERGNEMMIKGDGVEEDEKEGEEDKQEDFSGSDCEKMKVEQEENALAQCFKQEVENPHRNDPVTATSAFPEITVQNLQDFSAEVDSEENVEKMKDFSGEEHEEAGESFADYPSDFSSCEYVDDGVKNEESKTQSNALPHTSKSGSNTKQKICPEGEVTDITRYEDSDEEGDGYLYSRDLEMDVDRLSSFDVAAAVTDGGKCENVLSNATVRWCNDEAETGENDSYSSSEDEDFLERTSLQDLKYDKKPVDSWLYSTDTAACFSWSIPGDHLTADHSKSLDFDLSNTGSTLSEDLLTTEETDTAEIPLSDVIQRPAQDVKSYSVVLREDSKTTSPSFQGSLDDSFLFSNDVEASVAEQGQLGDDEHEEERNWEQKEERINAFYKFYNDSDGENEREERQIKVQFCTDPLSRVIHYETDSSDRDSLSSSITDREEDLSSAEISEEPKEPDNTSQMIPACNPPNTLPESMSETKLSTTQHSTRKHKCLGILKPILKMGLVIGMGLLMFWMGSGQSDWFSLESFFSG